ncbi:hypothetical protein LCY76_09475 [Fictibacillus sp. KIGAM418]|uniref:Uncharacterized protein n=1 Tax=Fictibacillus marinisediminis TaxID=2878389 RepID=A0A9X1XCD5_9BACL|nr:hypothetical protein [Fictibacillus marinisediminis]MCK6256823.1 hypothetical protein [Fictibacillus marinisediminis]
MNHLIIEVQDNNGLRATLKYPLDDLEEELVSTLGKRILEDVKDVEWTPHIDARKIKTEEQDLKYIGSRSLQYFVEGYNLTFIQGFIKYKRPITRKFVNIYKDNVHRVVHEDVVNDYGFVLKVKDIN